MLLSVRTAGPAVEGPDRECVARVFLTAKGSWGNRIAARQRTAARTALRRVEKRFRRRVVQYANPSAGRKHQALPRDRIANDRIRPAAAKNPARPVFIARSVKYSSSVNHIACWISISAYGT